MHDLTRILNPAGKSFFLLGPRGTGKTTWLRQRFPDAYKFDLLNEGIYQRLLSNPGLFAMEIQAVSEKTVVIIDEVQRLPNLLNEVHRFIENEGRTFILCGSSARKLKRSGVNLLAGRATLRNMHPLTPTELGEFYDLEEIMATGSLPIVWDSNDKQETLRDYARFYLKEEIQAEALVRNLPGFARFLPIAALYNAQTVNITNIAREAGVARTTVTGYLDILHETLLTFSVPAYEAKLRVRERKLPKLYWCDPGLVRVMKHSSGTPAQEERGALFEGLVAQTIRAYKDYNNVCDEFYYWASAGSRNTEVDFLLLINGEIVAVEVKSGSNFSDRWCRGLRVVSSLKNLKRRVIVYPEGPDLKTGDGIELMSFFKFAQIMAKGELLKF